MWKVPREGLLRADPLIAQPGQPFQHQIDLDLGARCGFGLGFAEQPRQHRGGHPGQHMLAVDGVLTVAGPVADVTVRADGVHLGAGEDLGTETLRRPR